ncbi:MAG: hypothetical protein GXY24_05650 [Bacteroidales bacterium]|jgi:hypothetical protein|nr:hypothetical protein [Bacteroidales bacterium]
MTQRFPTRFLLAALCLGMVLPACSRPEDLEFFVLRDDARDGVYVYTLPLQDTTSAYDFWFYSRTETEPLENLRLNVQWLSPSGEGFSESVYMREVGLRGSKELYRSGMIPAQAGEWQLSVRPLDGSGELLGFGVVCKKRDGTR